MAAATEATFMTWPRSRATMKGRYRRISSMHTWLLTTSTSARVAKGTSKKSPALENPALFTRMEMSRERDWVSFTSSAAAPGSARSVGITCTSRKTSVPALLCIRNSFASSSNNSFRRATRTKLYPRSASCLATSIPMPELAPVIKTCPSPGITLDFLLYDIQWMPRLAMRNTVEATSSDATNIIPNGTPSNSVIKPRMSSSRNC
mmetsp:Transcript_19037/g.36354  ORF Transcript_19037/g.36354 Transcript_19037/m.36354 type:complete len:205 (+) Transcript_19037:645-1259(+)